MTPVFAEPVTPRNSYDNDELASLLEGSGLFPEKSEEIEKITTSEGSGKSLEDEVAFLLSLPKMKVSGEVGTEEYIRETKPKNTVSVDTFLLNSPTAGIESFDETEQAANKTEPLKGAVEGISFFFSKRT